MRDLLGRQLAASPYAHVSAPDYDWATALQDRLRAVKSRRVGLPASMLLTDTIWAPLDEPFAGLTQFALSSLWLDERDGT